MYPNKTKYSHQICIKTSVLKSIQNDDKYNKNKINNFEGYFWSSVKFLGPIVSHCSGGRRIYSKWKPESHVILH